LHHTWYEWDDTDLVLAVYVQPGAKSDRIDGLHGERLKIRISAPPADGKANAQLIRFLARLFGVPQRQVTVVSGMTSRSKRIRIVRPAQLLTDVPPPPE
jgi:uncharacterized protein